MKLGRYEILEELGKGGFGIVYKAEDEVLGRVVALKVLHPTLLVDPGFIARFRNEARLAAQLDHPNLVPVYDFSEIEGRYIITMAHMAGGSLKDLLAKEGAQSLERALQILEDICQGLDYAHSQGIIHRDLKPSNILFDDKAVARISDLGFAKIVGGSSVATLTTSDHQVGTPSYMAPEIWKGQPATVASDLYSLACLTIELFTGKPFFDGESNPEIMFKHFQPREIPAEIPLVLRPVLEKALAEKPEQRFGSISEFLAEIKQGGDKTTGSDQVITSSKAVGSPGKTEGKKRWLPIAIIGALLVVLGVLFVSQIGRTNQSATPPTKSKSTLAAITENTEATEEPPVAHSVEEPTETSKPTLNPTSTPGSDIGSTMLREKDNMTMVYVPAGKFTMGSEDGSNDEKPVRQVYLDAYWIDKYEVSNGQFALCVEAGVCTKPQSSGSYTRSKYYGNPDYDNYPVIYVDWVQAQTYCEWVGGGLPTEAQWEKAARGSDSRTYPWGNDNPNNEQVNFNRIIGDTSSVTDYKAGASPFGAMNMAGNVWEWVQDWYGPYQEGETRNPVGIDKGEAVVVRGGSWSYGIGNLRSTNRESYYPRYSDHYIGFRCVFPKPSNKQTPESTGYSDPSNSPVRPEPTEPPIVTPEPTEPPVVTPEPTEPPVVTPEPTEPTNVTPEPTEPTNVTPEPTEPTDVTPEPTAPPDVTPEPTDPPIDTPYPIDGDDEWPYP